MDLLPKCLMQVLSISMVFSVILMALIQRLKSLSIVRTKSHIWILNLIFSFTLGIPFGIIFYQLPFLESIWIGVFSFIGASSIYETLKSYTPLSLSEITHSDS